VKKLKGQKVLITGAAAGIGRCAAKEFAAAGCVLILTDVNGAALTETADALRAAGATVHARTVDVSDRKAVDDLAAWVERDLGGLDVLINNAGIGHNAELADTSIATWERLLAINFWGPLYHVYAFLPGMIARKKGRIVNVSSGQAFFRLPTWGAYAVIKLALGAFSEMLRFEIAKHGVKVTTVYPFMVNTGFYNGVEGETWGARMSMRLLPYYSMTPEKVGRILFTAVRDGKAVEMVSVLNDLGYYARLVPPVAGAISRVTNLVLAKGTSGHSTKEKSNGTDRRTAA
jgi:NAD(P)-dependent dehydrogenase (short-subunit alcohol dehydrogenase family)